MNLHEFTMAARIAQYTRDIQEQVWLRQEDRDRLLAAAREADATAAVLQELADDLRRMAA